MGDEGKILLMFVAFCGKCSNFHHQRCYINVGNLSGMIKELRHQGWRKAKKYGWVCPGCYEELPEGEKR